MRVGIEFLTFSIVGCLILIPPEISGHSSNAMCSFFFTILDTMKFYLGTVTVQCINIAVVW